MKWHEREMVDIELKKIKFDKHGNIPNIDFTCLRITVDNWVQSIDIGSYLFTHRKPIFVYKENNHRSRIWLVDKSSLRRKRIIIISHYIEYLFTEKELGRSNKSIETTNYIFQSFINWCNKYHPDGLDSILNFKESIIDYTRHLTQQVKTDRIRINSASYYQNVPLKILEFIDNDPAGRTLTGIPLIRRNSFDTQTTPPPSNEEALISIRIYMLLFTQLTDHILNTTNFPWKLNLPEESVWVFPGHRPVATLSSLKNRSSWANKLAAYDFENGKINDLETTMSMLEGSPKAKKNHANQAIEKAQSLIYTSNNNSICESRIRLATLAQQSFIMLFAAHTGMNLSSIASIPWNNNSYTTDSTIQGFKTIKKRACNKDIEFHISNRLIGHFNTYLKLREYLCNAYSNNNSLLFFRIHNNSILPINMSFSNNYNERIKHLFQIDLKTCTRDWRSHKSNWLINNTDLRTTSLILQNTTHTVLKSYTEGSDTRAAHEMTSFYDGYKKTILATHRSKTIKTIAGRCRNSSTPEAEKSNINIKPDCIRPEGCLFCKHFAIVADREDIHKLSSLRYIIQSTRHLSKSDTQYESIFGTAIKRIDSILDYLGSINSKTKRIIEEVNLNIEDNEILTPYWDRKLKLFNDIGIII